VALSQRRANEQISAALVGVPQSTAKAFTVD